MIWSEISAELESISQANRTPLRSRQEGAPGPILIALVGPEGIGKFTLARKLAHEPLLHERYADGILWLGEDGSFYPRQWLRDYSEAIGERAPFGDREVVDEGKFQALFADRRVLFVADRLTASDMLPTLMHHAGPRCTVLVLTNEPSLPDSRFSRVDLAPLALDPGRFEMPGDAPSELIDFAGGNPLLLRVAAAGATVVEPNFLIECAEKRLAEGDGKRPPEPRRAAALVAGLWSTELRMPGPKVRPGPNVGGLNGPQRLALRRLIMAHDYATRFSRSDVEGGGADFDALIRFGLLEDLGSEVRLHRLIRAAIGEIDPETAEIAAMLRELEQNETAARRRVEIGRRLDRLGDPRRGVGIDADGTPDIDWCAVPAGVVAAEEERRSTKRVDRFHIARFPITVTQFRAFLEATDGWSSPEWWADDLQRVLKSDVLDVGRFGNHPAVYVSWFDATAFCHWLSHRLGFTVRLPDEWEWRLAATGGDVANEYPWGPDWARHRANTYENSLAAPTAVGLYPAGASPCRAHDMAGTVWEWCLNRYDGPDQNDDDIRAVRGGSWYHPQDTARCAYPGRFEAQARAEFVGFRVACSSPGAS